jgi:hypothetical protein
VLISEFSLGEMKEKLREDEMPMRKCFSHRGMIIKGIPCCK